MSIVTLELDRDTAWALANQLTDLAIGEAAKAVENSQVAAPSSLGAALGRLIDHPSANNGRAPGEIRSGTVVTFYNGAEAKMPETVQVLQSALGVTIQTATDPTVTANVIVVTGTGTPQYTVPPGG